MFVLEEMYHLSSLDEAGQQFDSAGEPVDMLNNLAVRLQEYRSIYNQEVLEESLNRLYSDLKNDPEILAHNKSLKEKLLHLIQNFH